VQVECDPDLVLDTYPGALGQVLTNLFMNAVVHAYSPGGTGTLTLRISRARPGTIRILFADDGRGIDGDHLAKVFDPFFTTARGRGSTGLGLHIVFNLVTSRLQGKIDVTSKPGEGTSFTILLPMRLTEAVPERMLASA
jgi:signal transduction histidine kinase